MIRRKNCSNIADPKHFITEDSLRMIALADRDFTNDRTMGGIDLNNLDIVKLKDAVEHFEEAEAKLPTVEQKAYRDAQQSVVDARRAASRMLE